MQRLVKNPSQPFAALLVDNAHNKRVISGNFIFVFSIAQRFALQPSIPPHYTKDKNLLITNLKLIKKQLILLLFIADHNNLFYKIQVISSVIYQLFIFNSIIKQLRQAALSECSYRNSKDNSEADCRFLFILNQGISFLLNYKMAN